jgi:hypothetical protein
MLPDLPTHTHHYCIMLHVQTNFQNHLNSDLPKQESINHFRVGCKSGSIMPPQTAIRLPGVTATRVRVHSYPGLGSTAGRGARKIPLSNK